MRLAALVIGSCLVAGVGCSRSRYVVVEVRTDLRVGVDFDRVRVELGAQSLERVDDGLLDWGEGVRAAEFAGLGDRPQELQVALLDRAQRVVLSRRVSFRVSRSSIVTVVLAQQCRDVDCSSPETACHFGRCVSSECTEETPEFCGERECEGAADCQLAATECAVPSCSRSGGCWLAPRNAACGPHAQCDVQAGCVPRMISGLDAGSSPAIDAARGPDAAPEPDAGTTGLPTGSACEFDEDCASGRCQSSRDREFCFRHYCTTPCTSDQQCWDAASAAGSTSLANVGCDMATGYCDFTDALLGRQSCERARADHAPAAQIPSRHSSS